MEKCLVLGASGFIGKNLVRSLAEKYNVIAYSNVPTESFNNIKNVTQVIGDFKYQDWSNVLDGVSIIFHLISTTIPVDNTDRIIEEIDDNIVPTVRFLEAIKTLKIKRFIFISSGGTVYGDSHEIPLKESFTLEPISSYGVQKKVIESYISFYSSKYKIPCSIARVSNPYGIGSDLLKPQGLIPIFLNKIMNNEEICIWGDGENVRDYIYMNDLILCLTKLIHYDGDCLVFNVGSGVGHSINEIISTICEITGNNISPKYLPSRGSDVLANVLDISLASNELFWSPKTDITEGISKLYEQIKFLD